MEGETSRRRDRGRAVRMENDTSRRREIGARASIGGGRGGGDASPPHFSGWGDSIGIVPPPLFTSEKLRGMSPDSTLLSLKNRYMGLARQ